MEMDLDTDIVILGAGLSGLAAAEAFSAAGERVLLLEKEKTAGGLAATVTYKNFKFDLGGHRLYFQDKALAARVEKLLKPEPLLRLKRRSSNFVGGRFLSYPPTLLNGLLYAAPALLKRFRGKSSKPPPEDSLKGWLHDRFGAGIHDAYFKDYTLKVWGLPTESISAVWAERRIGPMSLKNLFLEMLSMKSASKENTLDFLYPRDGIGGLCAALQKKLPAGSLCTGAVPLEFGTAEGKIDSVLFEQNGKKFRVACRQVVSTIPLTGLAPLFREDHGPASSCRGIKYRSLIVLFASMKRKEPLRDHWLYFPEKEVFFSRACELSNWSPAFAGADGALPITFEIFCDEGDATWKMKDEDLLRETERSLREMKIFGDFETADFTAVRLPNAYPLLYSGFEGPLEDLKAALGRYGNLELCGRTGAHAYLDMEECLQSAAAAAARVLAK